MNKLEAGVDSSRQPRGRAPLLPQGGRAKRRVDTERGGEREQVALIN